MKIITMLLVAVICVMCVCGACILAEQSGYDSPFGVFVASAEELPETVSLAADTQPESDNFTLPAGYSTWQLTVTNSINDISFDVVGCYRFDTASGMFNVRLYSSELQSYIHYLQIDGYTFTGFTGWVKVSDGSYYEANYSSINSARLEAVYAPKNLTVVFMDGMTNEVIQTLTASYGSEVKAPNAPDYSADGYVFTGWQGGDVTNVTRNTTVYSVYAPARYITCVMPDGSEQTIAVAQGSTLDTAVAPEYEDREFKYWRDEDGYKLDAATITVDYDMTLEAVYATGMPQWAKTLLIVLGSLVGAALIITVVVLIIKRIVRRTA